MGPNTLSLGESGAVSFVDGVIALGFLRQYDEGKSEIKFCGSKCGYRSSGAQGLLLVPCGCRQAVIYWEYIPPVWEKKPMLIYLQAIEDPDGRSRFERLYEAYRGLMFHVARRILSTDQDAEDAVHEAFLKISKKISKISDPVCPKTRAYVVLVVERTAIDLWRKQKRRPSEPLEADVPGLPAAYDGDNDLARCILALPAQDREVVLLRFWQGYSVKETAAILGISEAACRKREQRAKERLEILCREAELL